MDKRTGNGAGVLIWIIALALLMFTGFRSVHLVSSTLPGDAQILGFAALGALDLGLLGWMLYATRGARGAQRTIAVLMVCVDMAGVAAATIGDTFLVGGGAQASGMVGTIALWVLPIIVVANIGATVAVHIVDPSQALRDAKRSLSDELEWQLADHLRANAGQVASGVTPAAAAHAQQEMIAAFLASTMKPTRNGQSKAESVTMTADGAPFDEAVEVRRGGSKSRGR